ncbi:MAG: DNA repair protein RecN [Alphaproteobacteria bacterium]
MLTTLRIQNVVLIKDLTIEFDSGLCALTGETGAGKSILLDSLGLAIGARADSGLVRRGAEKSSVTAVFELPATHPAKAILEAQDLSFDPTLMLRRTLTADGRSRAYINDQPVSAALLKSIGQSVLEIHGQFDTQILLDPKTHRGLLDDYAGADMASTKTAWQDYSQAKLTLTGLQTAAKASVEHEEYLRTALEDLDALEPNAGEEETLANLRESLMHREQILEGLSAAYHALNAEDDPLSNAAGTIDRIADKIGEAGREKFGGIAAALDRATNEVQEALSEIQSLSSDLEHSEHDLQSIDDRLFALRAQARKHECSVDTLADKREALAAELNAIEHADERIDEQFKIVEAAKLAYEKEALALRALREKAATKLDALIAAELPPLKMERAAFLTRLESLEEGEWSANGMDRIRFLVATNPGAEPGALNKIASGGEMSRFMLALKVVTAETGAAGSLIFDEVDAGIGGGTADAVGERLARLAGSNKQILVVTHSPQVAARAAHHWIVEKSGDADAVTTTVIPLGSRESRRNEIARMLAGATITPEAQAAADKLLEVA